MGTIRESTEQEKPPKRRRSELSEPDLRKQSVRFDCDLFIFNFFYYSAHIEIDRLLLRAQPGYFLSASSWDSSSLDACNLRRTSDLAPHHGRKKSRIGLSVNFDCGACQGEAEIFVDLT